MKYIITGLFVLIPLLSKSQPTQNQNVNKNLHSSINTTGGEISGAEGSVSYSIGQVNYLSNDGNSSNISEGVQQPLVISIRPIENKKEVEVEVEEGEEEILRMAAYPNPVSDYFIIEASNYTNRSLRYFLTDLNGNFIKEGRIEEPGAIVDVSRLAVAMYLLNITDNARHIKTFRIIKK